jgi:carboxypeptidase Taq
MASDATAAFARLVERFSLAGKLFAARMQLNWDAQTYMPPGGAWARGEVVAALVEIASELSGSRAVADDLEEAEANADALTPVERADLHEMRRLWRQATAVPAELAARQARLVQNLFPVWVQARARNDFASFAAPFADLLAVIREIAAARAQALGSTPYGALLDYFDPGITQKMVDTVFTDLERFLPPLLAEARERQQRWPVPLPFGNVAADRQAVLANLLAQRVGHRPEHCRIDPSAHPFSMPGSPGDVRFTLRHDVGNVRFSVVATLHESGHAMYELNLPRELAFRPAGRARGSTVHESQALMLEMFAGRSLEFLSFLAPLMERTLLVGGAAWSFQNVVNTWRRLDDGCIRGQADEISYPLHVILRYRIEQALIAGDLEIADIPVTWNDLSRELLGRVPPTLAAGCLQDYHWASGYIGYFPTYAMGAVLAAQLFERAVADDPGILRSLSTGDFSSYFRWLRPRIHERASLTDFTTLVAEASGGPLDTSAFKRHLQRRYLEEALP